MNQKSRAVCLLCSIIAVLLLSSSAAKPDWPLTQWQGRTMGSDYIVKIVGTNLASPQLDVLKAEVDERLKEVNRQMSHYQADSELSRFNRSTALTPFKVSTEFAHVVRFSLEMFRKSDGAFDPTLAPVINLWGFGEKTEVRAIPPEEELRQAMKQTGAQHLSVTAKDELVKAIPQLSINLSAVAKGYGVDAIIEVLTRHGFANVYAAIAGDLRVRGHNPKGTNWLVGISAPIDNWRETDAMAAAVSLSNKALSTSGDYQKFFTDAQGRRLAHIIDPRTGWPVQHEVTGVSVVAADSMTADALDTTIFVLGLEKGLRLIESVPDAAALFIVREPEGKFRLVPSSRFEQMTGFKAQP